MIINGPNLNMLGIREKNVYGNKNYADLTEYIKEEALKMGADAVCLQSNHEGQLIDWIQQAYFEGYSGIVINPGGYTHTSVAIADAIKAVAPMPVAEVHISDTDKREPFRRISYSAPCCVAQIKGLGFKGYTEALKAVIKAAQEQS